LSNPTFTWAIPGLPVHRLELKHVEHKGVMVEAAVCETCSVPYTIDAACKFMRDNNVRNLGIDGQNLRRQI
jgi:hypothetical protein